MGLALRKEDALSITAEEVIEQVLQTYDLLNTSTDLSPNNDAINKGLRDYVHMAQSYVGNDVLNAVFNSDVIVKIRPHLLKLLGQSESCMEHYFAEDFTAREKLVRADLEKFWYLRNYQELVQQDLKCLYQILEQKSLPADWKPLFMGSGPLPLSAVLFHLETGLPMTCIDCDERAVELSRKFIQRLGLQDKITVDFICATEYEGYADHELIFMAALVCEKQTVFERIKEQASNAIVAARSVEGLRCLLYDPLDLGMVQQHGYELKGFAKATDITVNSTFMFEWRK